MARSTISVGLVVAILVLPGLGFGIGMGAAAAPSFLTGGLSAPRATVHAPTAGTPFAFVSNFENLKLDGWVATTGTASVVTHPEFNGEPALASTATAGVAQVDVARSLTTGDSAVSFQAELYYARGGTGFVGLYGPSGPVAVVGITNGTSVYAGTAPGTGSSFVEAIPTKTSQPTGWVEILANVYATTGANGTTWSMDVYVDRTDVAAATGLSVPAAGGYTGGTLRTSHGTVDYTDIVFSTYQLATTIPGYNNMEGYGQGSGLLVSLLPRFTTLSADLVLQSWTTPQDGILSIQVNAMNRVGTTTGTCTGFYQLGVDLNPGGALAPWNVPNNNCVAYYFNSNDTPRLSHGFSSPAGTHLTLRISESPATATITFTIVDHQVTGANHTVSATIPYNGSSFYGVYTQMEFQPCCATHPIAAYLLNATFENLTISGGNLTTPLTLPASYMLPYELDAPPTWLLNYYQASTGGYEEVG